MFSSIAKPAALAVLVASSLAADSPDFAPLCGKTLRVGVRTDAPPFAFATAYYEDTGCTWTGSALSTFGGFTASLCSRFLDAAQASCGASDPITVETVRVPIARRDGLLSAAGGLDLLCGATTATVTRRVLLPTSPNTFLTGSAIVTNLDFAKRGDGQSCRVGVVGGTTSASETDFSAREIRLPGWSQFAAANGCEDGDLDPDRRHDYLDTRDALEDLSKERHDDRKADLLIDDLHVLQWYLDNFAAVTNTDTAARRARLELRRDILSIEPYAVMGSAASDARVGAQQDEMSDTQAARPAPGIAVAAFARYLTDLQADKVTIDGAGYGDLLRRCFGRRIDRNMWFLIDLQANVRKGDFAADTARPDTGQ